MLVVANFIVVIRVLSHKDGSDHRRIIINHLEEVTTSREGQDGTRNMVALLLVVVPMVEITWVMMVMDIQNRPCLSPIISRVRVHRKSCRVVMEMLIPSTMQGLVLIRVTLAITLIRVVEGIGR